MNKFRSGWYLIYTKPRHEKKVHQRLSEIKINSFLPTRKIIRNWHNRKKSVDEPLFPSYVFIYLKDLQSYYEGIDTEGSLYYVRVGKEIACVSEAVVNNIKLAVNQDKDIEVSTNYYEPGRKFIISQGALTGLSCEVVRYNSKSKLLVRVDLLQRNLILTMPEDGLIAV